MVTVGFNGKGKDIRERKRKTIKGKQFPQLPIKSPIK